MNFPTLAQVSRSLENLYDNLVGNPPPATPPKVTEKNCGISDPNDIPKMEQEYFDCAQKLRKEGKYEEARSILRSLAFHSSDSKMSRQARNAYDDSRGDSGNYINLALSCIPFSGVPRRDWSDEWVAGAVVDGAAFLTVFTPLRMFMDERFNYDVRGGESFDRTFNHLKTPGK